MADRFEVNCVNKSDRYNPHERITHLGGNAGGKRWKITQQEMISGIEGDKWAFLLLEVAGLWSVIVATSRFGNKYVKTTADGEQPDNLLSLPECQ